MLKFIGNHPAIKLFSFLTILLFDHIIRGDKNAGKK